MKPLSSTHRSRLQRRSQRASYDRELVNRVLDEGLVCHVAFVVDGEPVVLPTTYARVGDLLYLHGAAASRMLTTLCSGAPCCVTVTLLDGLVLARSVFHHSMNYRSVVLFGPAREVTDESERRLALDAIVEHVVPGRSECARSPTASELAATRVVALPISEGSTSSQDRRGRHRRRDA
jgi:nitroimidazol reductase NimA-like FMN-containing flavoprotein (pyridoxamine 5'-phosphate oxidase superfamily)